LLDPAKVGNVVRIRVFVLTAYQLSPVSRPPHGKHGEIMDPAISKPHEALAHWQATKSL
jgi:hypothetical protein